MSTEGAVCVYCKAPAEPGAVDELGEYHLGRPMPVCAFHNDLLDDEPFDYEEWK